MAEIKQFPVLVPQPTGNVNPELVDMLRHALELAERGEWVGGAAIGIRVDGMGDRMHSVETYKQLGEVVTILTVLSHKLCAEVIENGIELRPIDPSGGAA
ncbi:MAG: hypothetical protein WDN46_10310 [Methylocella sp.]